MGAPQRKTGHWLIVPGLAGRLLALYGNVNSGRCDVEVCVVSVFPRFLRCQLNALAVLTLAMCAACAGDPGWTVTVYYTAVEEFHHGAPRAVTGCVDLDCTRGNSPLGSYPADFVQAVRDEGTGRTRTGEYLNWSHDVGFWLDDAPRDTAGRPLRPYESAAADPEVLPEGTTVTITDCGTEPVAAEVCERLTSARWQIVDEFTPGLGGASHIDVYLGEETGPDFTESQWYTTLTNARLTVRTP